MKGNKIMMIYSKSYFIHTSCRNLGIIMIKWRYNIATVRWCAFSTETYA